VNIEPITPHLGAEIDGFDLRDLSGDRVEQLKEMFYTHRVLAFRNQDLDRDAHKPWGVSLVSFTSTHPRKRSE